MSRESVNAEIAAARKKGLLASNAGSQRTAGSNQAEFNQSFYGKSDSKPLSQREFNARFYKGEA